MEETSIYRKGKEVSKSIRTTYGTSEHQKKTLWKVFIPAVCAILIFTVIGLVLA